MRGMHMGNYRFGNNVELPLEVFYIPPGGDVATKTVPLRADQLSPMEGTDFVDATTDLGRTATVLSGPKVHGIPTSVEISIAQTKGSVADGFDAQFSTGSSSLHNNKLQIAEVAMRSAEDPERQLVYVTHPGQGGSSPWTPPEAAYIKRYGRYTQTNGRPLPTLQAYAEALAAEGINISRVSCDADGASIATGFLVAQTAEVNNVHFNGAPIASGSILDEVANQVDDLATSFMSHDPARLSKHMVESAVVFYEHGRSEDAPTPQRSVLAKATSSHTPQKLSVVAAGLARQAGESGVHPAVYDTVALLNRHPEANIVFHMVKKAMSAEEAVNFLTQLRDRVHYRAAANQVQIVRTPGARRYHKAYPSVRRLVKQFAFGQY